MRTYYRPYFKQQSILKMSFNNCDNFNAESDQNLHEEKMRGTIYLLFRWICLLISFTDSKPVYDEQTIRTLRTAVFPYVLNQKLLLKVSGHTSLNMNTNFRKNVSNLDHDLQQPKSTSSNSQRDANTRAEVLPFRNHASISRFEGSINKIEFGTFGDSDKLNGTRTLTKLNETREFNMGNQSYTLTNLTNLHNCSGCLKEKNGGPSSLTSYNGSFNKSELKEDATSDPIKSKRCRTTPISIGAGGEKSVTDMASHDDDNDIVESNINCVVLTKRRLVTNHHTRRKTSHTDGTSTEKNTESKEVQKTKEDEKEEEKNIERQRNNENRKESNEQRGQDLQKLKEKILHGVDHYEPEPTEAPDSSRNIENQTMVPDPSMLPKNKEPDKMPDADHLDAGVGIVGMDEHPAIDPKLDDVKTKKKDPEKILTNGKLERVKDKALDNSTNSRNRTELAKEEVGPVRKRILCFGDSLTNGYTGFNKTKNPYSKKLEKLLEEDKKVEYEVLTQGINGECASREMLERLPQILKEESPLDLVIILAGTNDLLTHNCAKDLDLFESIKHLHDIVHSKGIKSVVVTIPVVTLSPSGTETMTREEFTEAWNEINQKLRLYAATNKKPDQVILSDLADELTRQGGKDGTNTKGLWADNIHPSVEGYDRMGQIIFKDINGKF